MIFLFNAESRWRPRGGPQEHEFAPEDRLDGSRRMDSSDSLALPNEHEETMCVPAKAQPEVEEAARHRVYRRSISLLSQRIASRAGRNRLTQVLSGPRNCEHFEALLAQTLESTTHSPSGTTAGCRMNGGGQMVIPPSVPICKDLLDH